MKSTPEDLCVLKSAGSDFLNVCDRAILDLSINHLSMSHEFVVVENLTLNVLIVLRLTMVLIARYRYTKSIDEVNAKQLTTVKIARNEYVNSGQVIAK